ncbi:hypothetical protein HII17_05700 [Thalassotalea sp. M1531]|uniref:Uncharacterized protein n=1 Tax=Thalassotalea algicola TaxID=2716224 RepID=A0A7Y0Q5J1_9GAMM|nr:hypothetical protein [Thalassotalea algicola]NMP31054.1 hypothetical protein [Thalassotalea algicola]
MARIFVSTSPKELSDLELAEHANELSGYIKGNKIVGALMLISGGVLAYYTGSISYYSCLFGLGSGFFMAQGRLSVLAERIKRLEKQLEY